MEEATYARLLFAQLAVVFVQSAGIDRNTIIILILTFLYTYQ